MHTPFFIIGIVLGGLGSLVCLVFTILSLINGKGGNATGWGIGFAFSVSVLIFSIVHVVRRVTEKVKSGIEWAVEHKGDNMYDDGDGDSESGEGGAETSKNSRQAFLDTLIAYTNEHYDGKVPVEFFQNRPVEANKNGTIVLPFLYPYSIRYNPENFLGDIVQEDADKVFVKNISQLAFDKNFVIAKVDNSADAATLKEGHGDVEYLLFDTRTGEYESFVNQEKLHEFANKIGYTGSLSMNFLSDDYAAWLSYPDYD